MSSIEHHISKDGSSTLFSKDFDQFYHNPNGAISESRHVFFEQSGLIKNLKQSDGPISIFEMGFGTGLNFFLLLEYLNTLKCNSSIHFYSIEAFPISPDLVEKINYSEFLEVKNGKEIINQVFTDLDPGWNKFEFPQYPNIEVSLFVGFFDDLIPPKQQIDFYFHDPFSPEVNPELWSVQTFEKLRSFANTDAVLSTYCAASSARAAMAKAGWLISRTKGALGKREMTVALLNEKKLIHLKRVNELRLIERLENGDFDN